MTILLQKTDVSYSQRHVFALLVALIVLFKHLPAALQQGTCTISLDTQFTLVTKPRRKLRAENLIIVAVVKKHSTFYES